MLSEPPSITRLSRRITLRDGTPLHSLHWYPQLVQITILSIVSMKLAIGFALID